MKAYKLKIELQYSQPLIWRIVIMPAGATFNRLHDVIQNVFNFNSGYPNLPCHLFEFDLSADNIRVTNDEEAYERYQMSKKNTKALEQSLRDMPPEFARRLRMTIRKPTGIKIDEYIGKYGELSYSYDYDYGDDWRIKITLEEVIEDYKHGYPTLIDGAETAPPEDVGGLSGFYEFLKLYHDETHPRYQEVRAWAKGQIFWEYDFEHINQILKYLKYKKNE